MFANILRALLLSGLSTAAACEATDASVCGTGEVSVRLANESARNYDVFHEYSGCFGSAILNGAGDPASTLELETPLFEGDPLVVEYAPVGTGKADLVRLRCTATGVPANASGDRRIELRIAADGTPVCGCNTVEFNGPPCL